MPVVSIASRRFKSMTDQVRAFFKKYWWLFAGVSLLIFAFPLFTPAFYFLWGLNSTRSLFQDQLGFRGSISTALAVVFMFLYTLALPYAVAWLLLGRRRTNIVPAFFAVLFVFGSKPLLTGILGSSFNAKTGAAQKCYSWRGSTLVVLEPGSTGCEIDPVSGQKTFEMTPDVAAVIERQQRPPRRIAIDSTPIQFFDPSSGRPMVWYEQAANGSIELYDSDGFSPTTGNRLKPAEPLLVTAVNRLMDRLGTNAVNRHKAEPRSINSYKAYRVAKYLSHPVALDQSGDNWVALRSEPLFRGYRLAKLGPNARFRIIGSESGWSKVELPDNSSGWILSKYVSD